MNDHQAGSDSSARPSHSLFSHDVTVHSSSAERSDDQGRPYRKSDDEAGPGRPLEMRFSGEGEPTDRPATY